MLEGQGQVAELPDIQAEAIASEPLSNVQASSVPQASGCTEELGLDWVVLASAFVRVEGYDHAIGSFVCDGLGHCGRGLGRYQYMSYRSDVREVIRQRSGGAEFLTKVDSGIPITEAEVERFFPPADQDALFIVDQSRNIEQAIQEGFTGARLIERVGQIHFGGPAAPVDGKATDIHGRLSLKQYGEELRRQYERAIGTRCLESVPGA
jgi:hypothetical protein